MKNWGSIVFAVIVILLIGGLIFIFGQNQNAKKIGISPELSPSPTLILKHASPTLMISLTLTQTVSPTAVGLSFCPPENLQANITLSHGAGNVYGTFTLKNISQSACQVLGRQYIAVGYDTNLVKNITITHIGQIRSLTFTLSPNQTIYSQVHYPNGPQCQSIGLNQTNVSFSYMISSSNSIIFNDQNGKSEQVVQTCKATNDMTELQIWNMSEHPIAQ